MLFSGLSHLPGFGNDQSKVTVDRHVRYEKNAFYFVIWSEYLLHEFKLAMCQSWNSPSVASLSKRLSPCFVSFVKAGKAAQHEEHCVGRSCTVTLDYALDAAQEGQSLGALAFIPDNIFKARLPWKKMQQSYTGLLQRSVTKAKWREQ